MCKQRRSVSKTVPIHVEDPHYLLPWPLSHAKWMRTLSIPRQKVREKSQAPKKKGVSGEHHCAKWHVIPRHERTSLSCSKWFTLFFFKKEGCCVLKAGEPQMSASGFLETKISCFAWWMRSPKIHKHSICFHGGQKDQWLKIVTSWNKVLLSWAQRRPNGAISLCREHSPAQTWWLWPKRHTVKPLCALPPCSPGHGAPGLLLFSAGHYYLLGSNLPFLAACGPIGKQRSICQKLCCNQHPRWILSWASWWWSNTQAGSFWPLGWSLLFPRGPCVVE